MRVRACDRGMMDRGVTVTAVGVSNRQSGRKRAWSNRRGRDWSLFRIWMQFHRQGRRDQISPSTFQALWRRLFTGNACRENGPALVEEGSEKPPSTAFFEFLTATRVPMAQQLQTLRGLVRWPCLHPAVSPTTILASRLMIRRVRRRFWSRRCAG